MRFTSPIAFPRFTTIRFCQSFLPAKWARAVFVLIVLASHSSAYAEAGLCADLTPYFENKSPALTDPSRKPNKIEDSIIVKTKIKILDNSDYEVGTLIVDADNDGKDDVFAWSIQGSGRFVYAELLGISPSPADNSSTLTPKASLDLGVLDTPRFIRFKGVNYLVYSNTGDAEGTVVSQITKSNDGAYQKETRCQMQTVIKSATQCGHPACKRLAEMIDNPEENAPFIAVEWPHKYFPPAGLQVYFSDDWNSGDIDNTKNPTTVWRFGRKGYMFERIYWKLLGLGKEEPEVEAKLRPQSEDRAERLVLPGSQHDRLRRTLAQQSEVLSKQLHRPVSLPNEGEFFLFNAHENRTYWAWDFGSPPYGEEIHIAYTNARKSDYIGMVRIVRAQMLAPCTSKCTTQINE